MATITKGYTFGATETVTAAKLHQLVDSSSISGILTGDISDNQITAAKINSVTGDKFSSLALIPLAAGVIPLANIPSIPGTSLTYLPSIPSGSGFLPMANLATIPGTMLNFMASLASGAGQLPWYSIVSSLASGGVPIFDGVGSLVGGKSAATVSAGNYLYRESLSSTSIAAMSSYTKIFECKISNSGTFRIKFSLSLTTGFGGDYSRGKIYRNGSPVGTEQVKATGGGDTEYSEDISGWSYGDLIQVYAFSDNGRANTATCSNFKVWYDLDGILQS